MQQQLIMQQQYPGNFQVPNFHSPSHIIHHHQQQQQQHLINLNLLQHERAKKQHKQQQHKPIVIEPTNVEMNASPNSFHGFLFLMNKKLAINQKFKFSINNILD